MIKRSTSTVTSCDVFRLWQSMTTITGLYNSEHWVHGTRNIRMAVYSTMLEESETHIVVAAQLSV
jgi:hypothetical protein